MYLHFDLLTLSNFHPMKVTNLMLGAAFALLFGGLTSCTKDDDNNGSQGQVNFEITDAPVDDPNIQSVFVTVASVKVDGTTISDFSSKQTIDLLAYQNGSVKGLGSGKLNAGTYTDVRLVLDYNTDAAGTGPGCYVLTKDGVKHALSTSVNTTNELKSSNSLKVNSSSTTNAVFDFDLRKAIKYTSSGTSKYQFVTDTELSSALRIATKEQSGTIVGSFNDALNLAGSRVVVYAYKKGTFTESEKEVQGTSGIRFKNAVSSAVVGSNDQYQLSFLESGDYSLYYVAYDDANSDGKLEEKGMLVLNLLGGLDVTNINVGASATVRLDVTVSGLLPL